MPPQQTSLDPSGQLTLLVLQVHNLRPWGSELRRHNVRGCFRFPVLVEVSVSLALSMQMKWHLRNGIFNLE
jgi:hypothetical protein